MQLHMMFNRPDHAELLKLLAESHYRAALQNNNTSSAVAVVVYVASGSLDKAIAAAALAQGGLHAPLAQARSLIESPLPWTAARHIKARGLRVPGFGNSFYKDGIDPAFAFLFCELPDDLKARIREIQDKVLPQLYPNAALITAAACVAAELPPGVESTIFTYCRTPAWVKLCMKKEPCPVGVA